MIKYIVGSYWHDENGVYDIPLFYTDTRNDEQYAEDGYSNIFTSHGSGVWKYATRFDTFAEADEWRKENLSEDVDGKHCGKVYRIQV